MTPHPSPSHPTPPHPPWPPVQFIKAKPKQEDVIDEKTLARLERADKRAERRRMKRF